MPFGVQLWHVCACIIILVIIIISIVFGMALMVLFGNSKVQDHKSDESYERKVANMHEKQLMHERQLIFDKQIKLINKFEQAIDETQRSTDRYVNDIREYYYLKERDESYNWFRWLNTEEKLRMYQLESHLRLEEIPTVKIAIDIVRKISEETLMAFSSQLEELNDALDEMDIDRMEQSQKDINKVQLSAFLRRPMDHMRSEMLSTSRALQKRSGGIISNLASLFFNVLVTVVSNIV